jgi:copper chaperone CopZ
LPVTTISIPGIHCSSCVALIKDVGSQFPAITKTEVNLEAKTVTLEHDGGLNFDQWKREVEALGDPYKVHPLR